MPVSPEFAQLKGFFEGPRGAVWAHFTDFLPELKGTQEINAGWFMYALRDAAARAGMHRDARTAAHFYRRIATEVNAAVDDGRLKGGPRGKSPLPPWRPEYASLMAARAPAYLTELFTLTTAVPPNYIPPSTAPDPLIQRYQSFLHQTTFPHDPQQADAAFALISRDSRFNVLQNIAKTYQKSFPWLTLLAGVCILVMTCVPRYRRGNGWLFVLLLGIALSVSARCLLLLFLDVTSIPTFDSRFLGPAQTVLMLAAIVTPAVLCSTILQALQARAAIPPLKSSHHAQTLPQAQFPLT